MGTGGRRARRQNSVGGTADKNASGLAGGISTATGFTRTGRPGGFGFGIHLDLRQALELRVDPDVFRSLDTESHAVAPDFENSNFDVGGNNDFLIPFPTNDKHRLSIRSRAFDNLRKYMK